MAIAPGFQPPTMKKKVAPPRPLFMHTFTFTRPTPMGQKEPNKPETVSIMASNIPGACEIFARDKEMKKCFVSNIAIDLYSFPSKE